MTTDYLSGMTQSEAIHFLSHLPNPTAGEVEELLAAAQRKPVARQGSHDNTETIKLRIHYLLEYLHQHPAGSTRREIDAALKYNGANMRRAIETALASRLITCKVINHRKLYTARGASEKRPASTTNGRRSSAEHKEPSCTLILHKTA